MIGNLIMPFMGAFYGAWIVYCIFLGGILIGTYLFNRYLIYSMARKKNLENGALAFFPITKSLVLMKIAKTPIWYIIFVGSKAINVAVLSILLLIRFPFKSFGPAHMIYAILVVAYILACLIFKILFYREYYKAWNINPNAAILSVLPVGTLAVYVIDILIALTSIDMSQTSTKREKDPNERSRDTQTTVYRNNVASKGKVVGMSGKYSGVVFDLNDGEEISFGRSAKDTNVVLDQTDMDISRKHCVVRFDANTNKYFVTDMSTNGVSLANGTALSKNTPVLVDRGNVIYLGKNKKNSFKLS